MKRIIAIILSILCFTLLLAGCNNPSKTEKSTITVAAASSLKNCMDDQLIPLFQEKYPNITIQTTYDSSGKLQAQIEEGASIDVFMSAAMKQMTVLDEKELIVKDSIVQLLENKIVLIVPENNPKGIKSFEEIINADTIAIGDPESVPAGQYAKEVLASLNLWDAVAAKASLGTNVSEVLNWVAEGSADAGIVYATDAASNAKVKTVTEAQEGSVSKVIYPVGIIKGTHEEEAAKAFVEFLESVDAKTIFETYGFTVYQ